MGRRRGRESGGGGGGGEEEEEEEEEAEEEEAVLVLADADLCIIDGNISVFAARNSSARRKPDPRPEVHAGAYRRVNDLRARARGSAQSLPVVVSGDVSASRMH
jgi:hypothetical protein